MRTEQQVVLVFGATGGVGSGVCRALARFGHTVVVHYFKNSAKAERLVEEIVQSGGQAAAMQADVRDLSQAEALVEQARAQFGAVHAGINFVHRDDYQPKEVADMEWRDWAVHLDAMQSHFNICKALLPVMQRQQYGRIIYISGGLAYRFYKGCAAYSAAKAGMNAFSKTLASEAGRDHITVNIIAPGKVVQTESSAGVSFQEDKVSACPTGRFTTPEDIANAAAFLISPAAEQITGQTLYLSGGEIMPMP